MIRLYSQFDVADNDLWNKVLDAARNGNLEALKAVGYTQEADVHPVCLKLLAFVGPGKKGNEIRDQFEAPPLVGHVTPSTVHLLHFWPRDIFVLLMLPASRWTPRV